MRSTNKKQPIEEKKEQLNNFAFIDAQNLNMSVHNQGWDLDYTKFRQYLRDKYNVSKAFMFIGFLPSNQNLYTAFQEQGYLLIFKPTIDVYDQKTKGNVDAELVLHTLTNMKYYDQAVVVTGDGDFYCLIDYLLKREKLHRLLVPSSKSFSQLYNPIDPEKIEFMDPLRRTLRYNKRPTSSGNPNTSNGNGRKKS